MPCKIIVIEMLVTPTNRDNTDTLFVSIYIF